MEKLKKESIYNSMQLKKTTIARLRAAVDRENGDDPMPMGKPITATWLLNWLAETGLDRLDLENREAAEKDGVA